jgi:hypothetical protein
MSPITFRPAKREGAGLLIGLAGASGSGKTYSALRLAKGLAGNDPVALIDTEAGRALHYADQFAFDHGDLRPPFTPAAYEDAIVTAANAGYRVILVDSFSHEHAGEGGLLDWHEAELSRMAGDDWKKRDSMNMPAWIKPKMAHKAMVQRLLQVRAHLIFCLRAEEKVEIGKDAKGKTVIRPKQSLVGLDGWIPICEKSLPFELTMSLLLTPDAPGIPKPIKLEDQHRLLLPLDKPISEQTGVALAEWAGGTASSDETAGEVQELITRLLELADVLGMRDATIAAITRDRGSKQSDLAAHARWLRGQVENAEEAVERRRGAPDEELFTEPDGALPVEVSHDEDR